jgi:hypothetical protein
MNWSDIARFHENYSRLMTETIADKLESVTIQNMLAQSKWFKEEFKERNKENSNEALRIAAEAGRARYVVKLIADNADVNEQGRTYPLHSFVRNGQYGVLAVLLDACSGAVKKEMRFRQVK